MPLGGDRTTPIAKGWSEHPQIAKKKKKNTKMGFGLLGVAGPPTRAWGGFVHPHTGRRG
jgi:hypothetical protein